MNYLFNTATGYMTLKNANKRYLKTEVQGEGEDRKVVPLNEIRSSDLEFDSTETLQIVDDAITVVPRPARVIEVPDKVDRWKLETVLQEEGKWDDVLNVANTLSAKEKRAVINGLKGAATISRKHRLVKMMIAIPELKISRKKMDGYFIKTKQYD